MFILLAVVMLIIAVFFIIRPLFGNARTSDISENDVNLALYREKLTELETELANNFINQEQFDASKADLEQQLLQDIPEQQDETLQTGSHKLSLLSIMISIPAVAIGLYLYLGNPEAIDPLRSAPTPAAHGTGPANTAPDIGSMVAKLEQRLQQKPDDARGWLMLARSYVHLKQFNKASKAYAEVIKRAPDHVQTLTDYADVIAVTQNGKLDGKPIQLLHKALTLEPNNPKALWLAGTHYFQQAQYNRAIQLWERLQNFLTPGSKDADMVQRIITEAKSRLTGKATTVPAPAKQPSTPAQSISNSRVKITGSVSLDKSLQSKVSPDDTVFIYARAASGPRMPLAVVRKKVKDLPLEFTLDDSMAMMPQMKLSNFSKVVVSARISKSGNAITQKGDLSSNIEQVTLSRKDKVTLIINNIVK